MADELRREDIGRLRGDNLALMQALREAKRDRDALRRSLRRLISLVSVGCLAGANPDALSEAHSLLAEHPYEAEHTDGR